MREGQVQSPEACYFFQVDNNDLINTLCIRIAQPMMNKLNFYFFIVSIRVL